MPASRILTAKSPPRPAAAPALTRISVPIAPATRPQHGNGLGDDPVPAKPPAIIPPHVLLPTLPGVAHQIAPPVAPPPPPRTGLGPDPVTFAPPAVVPVTPVLHADHPSRSDWRERRDERHERHKAAEAEAAAAAAQQGAAPE